MLRGKPLAAGSGRQPLTAPLEDRHLHHMDGWALTSQSAKDERRKIHTSTLVIPDLRFES